MNNTAPAALPMFARALIVLLIAINLGVALWWLLRADPAPAAASAQPEGVPRLQLLSEAKPLAPAAPTQPAAQSAPPQTPAAAPEAERQCFSLGPFADAAALRAADARVRPQALRVRTRTTAAGPARAYSVVLPPLASRELAQATADRIKAAGFEDFLLINNGDDANGIALGRYGSEATAQRRQEALRAAGFEAQVRPVGGTEGPSWLDVEARTDLDRARLRELAGAAQSPELDCARLPAR